MSLYVSQIGVFQPASLCSLQDANAASVHCQLPLGRLERCRSVASAKRTHGIMPIRIAGGAVSSNGSNCMIPFSNSGMPVPSMRISCTVRGTPRTEGVEFAVTDLSWRRGRNPTFTASRAPLNSPLPEWCASQQKRKENLRQQGPAIRNPERIQRQKDAAKSTSLSRLRVQLGVACVRTISSPWPILARANSSCGLMARGIAFRIVIFNICTATF